MNKLYSFLIVICLGIGASAQTKNDPAAKAVLDAVSAKFKTFTTVEANFTYKVENGSGKALSSKNGTLQMKGKKYRITGTIPEIFCDGTTVWSYDKDDNEVTISNLDPGSGSLTPQKLFTNFYDRDFNYLFNGEKKVGAKTIQEIELTPIDKSKSYHKVYLQIDKSAKTLYSARILQNAGNRYIYTVNSQKTNQTLADNVFIFDKNKYPGVEINDLR